MRKILPFDTASVGALELVWLGLLGVACLVLLIPAGRRLPRPVHFALGGALVAVLCLRPFGIRGPAEWAFLLLLAAMFLCTFAFRTLPAWAGAGGAALFFALCLLARPFGWGPLGAVLLLLLWGVATGVLSQGREMRRYVGKRLLGMPVVLLLLLTISFFLIRAAPGGPFDRERKIPPEIEEAIKRKYRLDLPLTSQYLRYMGDLLADGDLGPSFKQLGRSVNEIIARHIRPTAILGFAALGLAILIGVTAGLIAGIRRNSIFDYASMTGAMLGLALPTFVVGPMLVLVFALRLGWFKVTGWDVFPRDLILPAVTLSLPFAARAARLTRAGMLEIVHQDYVRTARAKGLSETAIVVRHTLKGAMLPVVSFLGPAITSIFTGSLVVETIFGVPGLGREFVQSALNRDYGMVLGLVLFDGALLVLFNLLVDIAYAFLDPRIRHA